MQLSAKTSISEYFLAGRKLSTPAFVATLVTTWYGNLLGVGEIAYKYGIVNWLTQGLFWYLAYLIFAFFISKKVNESKLLSIPDQLQKSYDKKTALLGALINFVMLTPAPYILSMGLVLRLVFGIDQKLGIVIGTLIPLAYVFKGGFKAVVWTDTIQFVLMYLGMLVIIPFAYAKYGGWEFIQSHVPESHFSITGSWSWQEIFAWFLIAFWTMVDPGFYQRTYAAKNSKTAFQGVLISIIFWLVFDLAVSLAGFYAYAALPGIDAKLSLPLLANDVLPEFFKWIFYAGLISTVMSTLDSLCFSSSMALSYDFCARIFTLKDRDVILLNKVFILVTVVTAMFIALYFDSLFKLIYLRGSLAISCLLVPLVASFFFKTNTKKLSQAGFWSILAGLVGFSIGQFFDSIEALFSGLLASLVALSLFRQDLNADL